MKKIIYIYVFLVCTILISSCVKDGGYYKPKEIENVFPGNTYEYLKSKPGVFDSLLTAIDRLQLQSTLKDSSITLFALTNQSFELAFTNLNNIRRLSDKPSEYLNNIRYKHLDTMITQYIIRGKYNTDSLMKQDGLPLYGIKYGYPMHAQLSNLSSSGSTGGGPVLISISDTKRSQFRRNWITAATSSINIKTKNALVHVVNSDHIFGFEDFVSRLTFIPPPPSLFKTIGGTFSVSREASGGPNHIEASKFAFDGNNETKFLLGSFTTAWLQFQLNQPVAANSYTLTSANDFPDRDPTDWNLQGSHDGVTWKTLDSRSGEIFDQRFQLKVFRINNTEAYTFYRLNITRHRSGTIMQMADWSVNLEEKDDDD